MMNLYPSVVQLLEGLIKDLEKWCDESTFVYPLLLSICSAIIFWIIFSGIPNHLRKNKIRPLLELDMYKVYSLLFQLFDSVMKHAHNSPSFFQADIRGGHLKKGDILIGLQNKCLNESYLFDPQVKDRLMIVGEHLFDISKKINEQIDKILNLSQFAYAREIILLEQIRHEIKTYDYGEKLIKKNASNLVAGQMHFPSVANLYYRVNSYFDLYRMFVKLQNYVLLTNSYTDRNIFISTVQYLFHSRQYKKCKRLIKKNRKKYVNDTPLIDSYVVSCEYNLKNKTKYYRKLEKLLESKPYDGSLISQRSFMKEFIKDPASEKAIKKYYTDENIELMNNEVLREQKMKAKFLSSNIQLLDYYITKDSRLKIYKDLLNEKHNQAN